MLKVGHVDGSLSENRKLAIKLGSFLSKSFPLVKWLMYIKYLHLYVVVQTCQAGQSQ